MSTVDMSGSNIEAIARITYERWVEGNDGVFMGHGLPPWTNSLHPDQELSNDQKQLWIKVATIPYMAGYDAMYSEANPAPDVTAVKHPEGTPEYAAYRAMLREELIKFAAGEEPYSYGMDKPHPYSGIAFWPKSEA